MSILMKLIRGEDVTEADLVNELYDVCDEVHSSCYNACPVYELNDEEAPNDGGDLATNYGCSCFKSGSAMLKFIREHS